MNVSSYDHQTRCKTLQKAATVAGLFKHEGIAQELDRRLQIIKEEAKENAGVVAPDIIYHDHRWDQFEQEQIEGLAEAPDLQMDWTPLIRSLCWLICVAESEQMIDERDFLIDQLSAYHPASPFLQSRGLQFHTGHPITIDADIASLGCSDLILECLRQKIGEHNIAMDKPAQFFLQKQSDAQVRDQNDPFVHEGALVVICRYIDVGTSKEQEVYIPLDDVRAFADHRGDPKKIEAFDEMIGMVFGA
jgi:hypothetical protein